MKFTKIEEYKKQQEGVTAKQTTLQLERNSALEKLQALKAEYTALITQSITSGENVDAALDKLSDSIADAERNYTRKVTAATMSNSVQPGISRDSVESEWNTTYFPSFKTEVFNPLAVELEKARDEYYAAYLKCLSAVEGLEAERKSVVYTLDPDYGLGNKYAYRLQKAEYFSKHAPYVIKDTDTKKLAGGVLPDNANKKGGAL